MVALKPWRKLLQGYIREKTQQLSGSALWHMPFLIRFVFLNEEKSTFSLLGITRPVDMNSNLMICSGGPTPVRTMGWGITKLVKLIGVGAGWNAGLLFAHGKAAYLPRLLPQRKSRVGSPARLVEV